MVFYEVYEERLNDEKNDPFTAYGIRAVRAGIVIRSIGDISTNREKIIRLAEVYQSERLAPEQLDEAIENFLYDFEV